MRRIEAIIHLSNLRHNLKVIRSRLKDQSVCIAVKADAYGHGAVMMAKIAEEQGVEFVAVSTVSEAIALRDAGIGCSIFLYGLPLPCEYADIARCNIHTMVADESCINALDSVAKSQNRLISCHLKIDTGMGRIGCPPSAAIDLAKLIDGRPHLNLAGVGTHLAGSDNLSCPYTEKQLRLFNEAINAIQEAGIDIPFRHAANSAAVMYHSDALFDLVRPGISFYGYCPTSEAKIKKQLRPVMELRSRLVFIKHIMAGSRISYGMTWQATNDTYIGTVSAGYADGYSRMLSNLSKVLIGGACYPVVGQICMDQFMVDLGRSCVVHRYDPVVLFGPQENAPTAEDLASLSNTIPYEITCGISKRVPRIYVE